MLAKAKEYLKYLIPFIAGVLIYSLITNYLSTINMFNSIFSNIIFAVNRFLIGITIAYFLNFITAWLRKTLKMKNWIAVTLAYIIFAGAIAAMFIYIIPVVGDGISMIMSAAPGYYENASKFANDLLFMFSPDIREEIIEYSQSIVTSVFDFMTRSVLDFSSISNALSISARFIIDIVFGILISAYILAEKDAILLKLKKIIYAFRPQEKADRMIAFFAESNKIFSQYVVGKIIDSLIVGVLSIILYLIFDIPLAPFLAIVAAFFNMIPYFGPWIGGAVTVVILVCVSPIHMLYAVIISVAIQILDGTYIGPKVLGSIVGVSPLLIIIAITIGGDIGGLTGMFFGVPVLAVLKVLWLDKTVERRLREKTISIE